MQKEEKILSSVHDAVLVIGNGFDMDLGLPTSYGDFVKSVYWPFKKGDPYVSSVSSPLDINKRSLHEKLFNASLESKWLDLELLLSDYATFGGEFRPEMSTYNRIKDEAKNDEITYETLCNCLTTYLIEIQSKTLNNDSVAARIIKEIVSSHYFRKIFSFNYTNLKIIVQSLGIETDFWYTHMHGNLEDGIILGIENQTDFCPLYRFMCKEYNENYQTRFLDYSLQETKEIVIFGHSLGQIDYHYFQNLFSYQSREDLKYPERKRITIFTRDKNSRMDILDQLRAMNKKRLDLLYGHNILNIIRTDGSDEERIKEFLDHVNKKSKSLINQGYIKIQKFH